MQKKITDLKIAIVHDFLVQRGGAEKVLEAICEIFPNAPIYTMLYDKDRMHGMFEGKTIKTSYLQKLPRFIKKRYAWLAPFLVVIPETFDFREFDLIISSSGAWSKGIVTKLNTTHVAYIHSPMRFVWDCNDTYLKDRKIKNSIFKRLIFSYLRIWDRLAADRPDFLIANSKHTQRQIKKYYRRESVVIYPPVALPERKSEDSNKPEYFLTVSRLSAYKKINIIVEAFNKLKLPLVVIGEGEEESGLKKLASENVKVLSWKTDEQLADFYKNARAFVFASEEDFGIVPVEAMSYGIPVIAFGQGGVLETVTEGVNGCFFDSQTPEAVMGAVRSFVEKENIFEKNRIIETAGKFSKERFKNEFKTCIEQIIESK